MRQMYYAVITVSHPDSIGTSALTSLRLVDVQALDTDDSPVEGAQ